MTRRRRDAFVDALAGGRRARSYRADTQDVEVLRLAIQLRTARPGDARPDDHFLLALREELVARAGPGTSTVQPVRRRTLLASMAATVALVGATVAATEVLTRAPVEVTGLPAAGHTEVRTGTFETTRDEVLGQIVAYRGDPSWVFMKVSISNSESKIFCELQLDNGATVAVGAFTIHNGTGQVARTVRINIGRLRGARLVTSDGSVVASATLA